MNLTVSKRLTYLAVPSPLSSMKTVLVINLPIAVTNYDSAIEWIKNAADKADRAYAVEAANTHVAALARHDRSYGKAMAKFDLICPDGMPLVWAVNRQLNDAEKLTDRVYGPTLMLRTIEQTAGDSEYKHFLLGGKQSTLDQLNKRFTNDQAKTNIVGSYSPPFGEWPEDEFEKICGLIKESGANLVWVGLGCPKQERWIAKNKENLPPAVYFGIGAAFAFHAGEVRQAPPRLQQLGLEWLYRLAMEPRRLFKRYFTYNSLFLWYSIFNKR